MQTVENVIRSVLPRGTVAASESKLDGPPSYETCPIFPPDVFAVVGKLVELSGAYHHIVPRLPSDAGTLTPARLLPITPEDVQWAEKEARAWRRKSDPPIPKAVQDEWNLLLQWQDEKLFVMCGPEDPPPKWWRSAVRLLMVADQASVGTGFSLPPESMVAKGDIAASWIDHTLRKLAPPAKPELFSEGLHHSRTRGIYTYSSADPNIVCVLPKVRTAAVGCNLRSLTHNLALLPAQGIARVWWIPQPDQPGDNDRPLNLVLIPYPYKISAKCFKQGAANRTHGWGWFEVDQRWLRPENVSQDEVLAKLTEFVIDAVEAATRDVGEVHGVIMPELALDFSLFQAIATALTKTKVGSHIEFFVCGTSDNGTRSGNFVCTVTYARVTDSRGSTVVIPFVDDRQKHHRWRLDRYQICRYGLTSALDPDLCWWEDLPILSRSISIQQFRGNSVYTSMICEDLARVDPCQEALRSIGPNLMFALLMDGPQLRSRWPARYATILAEDPGCSVLTLTSMGLIERANESGEDSPSNVVALWKDLDVDRREIRLELDALAVCITLNSRDREEFTLDGRSDGRAAEVWTLGSVRQIHREAVARVADWIQECP